MLAFPQWSSDVLSEGCRGVRWAPPPRFATYIARPVALPSSPPRQFEDEDSSGGSSPERSEGSEGAEVCDWRGCGAQFSNVSRLSAHVARAHAHPHRDGLFYCGWQGCVRPQRGFNARYKMLVHVRTHTNERPHICTQCQKSFSRAENLKIHLRSHSGEKPYVCPYEGCGKAYSNSSDRFKHTRTHTVDKPYCCKVAGCNKRYTDPSSLRKHVKTYKHFTPKTPTSSDASPEQISATNEHAPIEMSPLRDIHREVYHRTRSPLNRASPVRILSPSIGVPPFNNMQPVCENISPVGSPIRYSPIVDQPTYIKSVDPIAYPLRVPAYEMSYLEYSQMYEHAYRAYYSNNIPLPAPTYEKVYYEDKSQYEVSVAEKRNYGALNLPKYVPMISEDMPLNLKCTDGKVDCRTAPLFVRPFEDSMEFQLVKTLDMPLDLSTKS